MIDDPICAICKEPMEPIPPVGWVCLSQHEELASPSDHRYYHSPPPADRSDGVLLSEPSRLSPSRG
jgi:hypothetical protein